MSYVKNEDILIPIFDGVEYENWKTRLFKFLEMKGCLEVVQRQRIASDQVPEWTVKVLKATNYIYSAITNRQLERIKMLTTPFEMITKLDNEYLKKSTAMQIVARNNLERIKLESYSDPTKFFDAFERALNDLKSAGATCTEPEALNYMIKARPLRYSHLGDLIYLLPEGERTVEFLKCKIKTKSLEHPRETVKHEDNAQASNAFSAETKSHQRTCYKCGKPGHYQRVCRGGPHGRGGQRGWSRGRSEYPRGSDEYARGSGEYSRVSGEYSRGSGEYARGSGEYARDRGESTRGRGNFSGNYRGQANMATRYREQQTIHEPSPIKMANRVVVV